MKFTRQEFDIMVDELVRSKPARFDMLCEIAYKTLEGKVSFWCSLDSSLRGRGLEEDVMQEVIIRLIQKTVSGFLLRDGADGPINDDPEGFEDWMFTVAGNIKRGFAKKARLAESDTVDDGLLDSIAVYEDFGDERAAARVQLSAAFDKVIHFKMGVQKILSWVGLNVFMLTTGNDRIRVTNAMDRVADKITLDELYDLINAESRYIGWLAFTEKQKKHIRAELDKKTPEGITYGQTVYSRFFSANGGKASISDWYYKINKKLRDDI